MSSDSGSTNPQPVGSAERSLRNALLDRWPSARVLDRELRLDGEELADFALEESDRVWLVLRKKRLDRTTAAVARATLDRARELGSLLIRSLGSDASQIGVLLVVRDLVEGGQESLRPALDAGLVLLRRHKLHGARGKRLMLEVLAGPLAPAGSTPRGPLPVAGLAPEPARFVAGLDPAIAPLAAELIRRQARLDPELTCEGDEHGLVWIHAEEVLCTLSAGEDGLECRVAGVGVPRLLRSAPDLEEWLDFLLAQLFERWPGGGTEPSFEIPRPDRGGHWLSPEEYQAFQD